MLSPHWNCSRLVMSKTGHTQPGDFARGSVLRVVLRRGAVRSWWVIYYYILQVLYIDIYCIYAYIIISYIIYTQILYNYIIIIYIIQTYCSQTGVRKQRDVVSSLGWNANCVLCTCSHSLKICSMQPLYLTAQVVEECRNVADDFM